MNCCGMSLNSEHADHLVPSDHLSWCPPASKQVDCVDRLSARLIGVRPSLSLVSRRCGTSTSSDVLPKGLPVIPGVRGWYGAHRGGVAQPAWQHRRALARRSRYPVAHGCSRRGPAATRSGRGRATASRFMVLPMLSGDADVIEPQRQWQTRDRGYVSTSVPTP
jgi:hypothetical protein